MKLQNSFFAAITIILAALALAMVNPLPASQAT
jgi:hypothetical protein